MNNSFFEAGYISVTAHTGCEDTPMNSIESIAKAYESGADIVEFDISFNKNNVPVLSHDKPKGGEITVEEAFIILGEYKELKVNLDIKGTENLAQVQNLAKKHNMLGRVFYTGVSEAFVEAVRKDSPEIMYYLNLWDILPEEKQTQEYLLSIVEKIKSYNAIGLNFPYKNASAKLIEMLHKHNLLASLWTINTKEDFYRVLDMSPDNITTKKPTLAKSIIKN